MPCYSPLKGFVSRENGGLTFRREQSNGTKMEVACGQCLGCRLDRSRMWAMRCVHEASLHELDAGNCFITLTYNDEHIPYQWTLRHKDFQDFMKRLRKYFSPQKIMFYMAGEYGEKCPHIPIYSSSTVQDCDRCNVGRPHYHAILFNCSFDDLLPVGQTNGVVHYSSPLLESIWGLGHVQVGEVTFESCAYVARYITKKITGHRADDHYMRIGDYGECHRVEPEYNSMSRGARKGAKGIGAAWYEDFKADLWPYDEVPVPGSGVYKKVPRYYEDILRAEDEEQHQFIKEKRQQFRRRNAKEYTPERLMAKYKVKKAQAAQLKRGLEE